MEFSIPTNWQPELVRGLCAKACGVKNIEVYGKLALDDVGGGRSASGLAFVSRRGAQQHIGQLRNAGFKFNYLLNAVCLDNREFTRSGQKRLRKLVDWLVKTDVDSVTIANAYLMMWIKKNYPSIPVTVSAMANVSSLKRAKFWESLGADKITFPGPLVNRNFSLIRLLRKSLNCRIQLIANNGCQYDCPTYNNHSLASCHASQKWHKSRGYMFDYCSLMCRLRRLQDPVNFIRSDWIRPEDVTFYERLGVESIKLVDRRLPSALILKIMNAYFNGYYEGNLVDLIPVLQGRSFNTHKRWIHNLFHLFKHAWNPLAMNPVWILRFSQLSERININIDNTELDGFLRDRPEKCDYASCAQCNYCKSVADRAININADYLKNIRSKYEQALNQLFQNGLSFSFPKRRTLTIKRKDKNLS